jgi:hypothetical protein
MQLPTAEDLVDLQRYVTAFHDNPSGVLVRSLRERYATSYLMAGLMDAAAALVTAAEDLAPRPPRRRVSIWRESALLSWHRLEAIAQKTGVGREPEEQLLDWLERAVDELTQASPRT